MIFIRASPLLGPLEGVGPENLDFFGPTPSNGFQNGFAGIKIKNHYVPRHTNNRYTSSYRFPYTVLIHVPYLFVPINSD